MPTYQARWNGLVPAESEHTIRVEGNQHFPPECRRGSGGQPARNLLAPHPATTNHVDPLAIAPRAEALIVILLVVTVEVVSTNIRQACGGH